MCSNDLKIMTITKWFGSGTVTAWILYAMLKCTPPQGNNITLGNLASLLGKTYGRECLGFPSEGILSKKFSFDLRVS